MRKLKFIYSILFVALLATGCSKEGIDEDLSFLNTGGSSNLSEIIQVTDDNSGIVKFTPLGQGASRFTFDFGHNGDVASITAGETATHAYPEGAYTVTITTFDISGRGTAKTYPLNVTYRAPENLAVNISADMKVSAEALYANSFLVYYGDVANETPTPMAVGETLPAHIYPAGGPYDLTVVAQSGGAATTQSVKTLFGFPLTFESPTMEYFFGTFGNTVFSKVANPSSTGLNTSAMVGKYAKPTGAETWSGTYSPLNIPINFAHGNKVKLMIYNPDAANIGKLFNVELESAVENTGATPNGVGVLKMPLTTSGAWEELTFDFSTIAAIGSTARFGQLVFRFNDVAPGSGEVIYVDNIRITN
jgi:hypothetical protein